MVDERLIVDTAAEGGDSRVGEEDTLSFHISPAAAHIPFSLTERVAA